MISNVNYSPSFSGMKPAQLQKFIPEFNDEGARCVSRVIDRKLPDLELITLSGEGVNGILVCDKTGRGHTAYHYKGNDNKTSKLTFIDAIINNIKLGWPVK